MAPEFEAAAKELKGRVRFCKLDTDKEETMAARLQIMGLPTTLFLDQYKPEEGDKSNPKAAAVLKGRLEGALRKDMIVELCEYYFFDGPLPKGMS
jgi:thioredoxin-like negative regulator of GroEL